MILYANGRRLPQGAPLPDAGTQAVAFIAAASLPEEAEALSLAHVLIQPVDESAANRFESHAGYDCIMLNMPDKSEDIEASPINIDIYMRPEQLLFVHDQTPEIDALMQQLDAGLPFDQTLLTFFNLLTGKDTLRLEAMEEAIARLEDDIAEEAREAYLEDISTLRKKLLKQKRYFESLMDALEDLEENQNGLLTPEQLRSLRLITNRVGRQYHAVLNLRDYVTQVRESYQSQMDIHLNKIMKLFTVITAIFSPLTLLVGWYGMNLVMPEAAKPFMYPLVIVLCVAIVGGMVVYFKKNDWF